MRRVRRPNGWELITAVLAVVAVAVMSFGAFKVAQLVDREREAVEALERQAERREERTDRSQERIDRAVERVIDEVRNPQSDAGDTREQTFDRIRQLCEVHVGCEP